MRKYPIAISLSLLLAVMLSPDANAQCYDTGINPKTVEKLLGAADVAALDAALKRVGAGDVAIMAVYRKRRLALNPVDAEEVRFLRSLPKTASDAKRLVLLTATTDICELPEVAAIVYGMYNTAAKIIKKQGKSHRALIDASVVAEAELADTAWPAFDWLLENDTKLTLSALRILPEADRTRICHGQDPRKVSEKNALEQCRSGL